MLVIRRPRICRPTRGVGVDYANQINRGISFCSNSIFATNNPSLFIASPTRASPVGTGLYLVGAMQSTSFGVAVAAKWTMSLLVYPIAFSSYDYVIESSGTQYGLCLRHTGYSNVLLWYDGVVHNSGVTLAAGVPAAITVTSDGRMFVGNKKASTAAITMSGTWKLRGGSSPPFECVIPTIQIRDRELSDQECFALNGNMWQSFAP